MPDDTQNQGFDWQGLLKAATPYAAALIPAAIGGLAGGRLGGGALGAAAGFTSGMAGEQTAQNQYQNELQQATTRNQQFQNEQLRLQQQDAYQKQRLGIEQQKVDIEQQKAQAAKPSEIKQQKENEFYTLVAQHYGDGNFPDYPSATMAVLKSRPDLLPHLPSFLQEMVTKPGKEPTTTNEDKQRDIFAQAAGYKDFASIPDATTKATIEQKRINMEKTQPGISINVARAGAYEEQREKYQTWARTDAPVQPEKLNNYVNMQGTYPTNDPKIKGPGDTSPTSLNAKGYRYLPDVRLRPFQSGLQALTQLDRIDKAGQKLFQGVGFGENVLNAVNLNAKKFVGDPDVRGFQSLLLETMPTLALQSGLTPGRVGDQVITKIEQPMMPNMTDTIGSFNAKMNVLKQRVQNNIKVNWGLGVPANLTSGIEGPANQGGFSISVGGQEIPVQVK